MEGIDLCSWGVQLRGKGSKAPPQVGGAWYCVPFSLSLISTGGHLSFASLCQARASSSNSRFVRSRREREHEGLQRILDGLCRQRIRIYLGGLPSAVLHRLFNS